MRTLAITALLTAAAYGQIQAGSAADQYHGQQPTCAFDAAGHALNAPCVRLYTDASVQPSTLFYEIGAPLTYSLTAPTGTCDVQMTTWEPNATAAAQRVFSVVANGVSSGPVDLFVRAGLKVPYMLVIPRVPIPAGSLTVQLLPQQGNALTSTVPQAVNCQAPAPPGLTSTLACPAGVSLTLVSGVVTAAGCNSPCTGTLLCAFVYHETLTGTADGTNVLFMLKTVPYPGSVQVWVNGTALPPSFYTVTGTSVVLTVPPAVGASVLADYRA